MPGPCIHAVLTCRSLSAESERESAERLEEAEVIAAAAVDSVRAAEAAQVWRLLKTNPCCEFILAAFP